MSNLPVSEGYLETVAENIFGPIRSHDCSTCLFVAGGGKRTIIHAILNSQTIMEKILGISLETKLLIYINPDELLELTSNGYLDLLCNCLKREAQKKKAVMPTNAHGTVLEQIKDLTRLLIGQGYSLVFILHDFDKTLSMSQSIYLNLESIMGVNKSMVTFLFLSSGNLLAHERLNVFDNLKYAITQHVSYYPLLPDSEIDYVLGQFCVDLSIHEKTIEILRLAAGGHPQLLKYSCSILSGLTENERNDSKLVRSKLIDDLQLRMICADIWERLTEDERIIVLSAVRTGQLSKSQAAKITYLMQTGILKLGEKKLYRTFCELFSNFVGLHIPKENLIYDKEQDQIYYGTVSCGKLLTPQEFKLLVHFLLHEKDVVSRDEIGQVLWGKEYFEKYSDWMIDKVVSTIRKKLESIGFASEKLATLKKRGFCLTQ